MLDALIVTATSLGIKDPAMFLLIPLGLLGGWHLRRMTITWVAVGAWLASSSTLALNLPEYRFWAPGIIFSIPLIGYGAAVLMGSAYRRLAKLNELNIESILVVDNWSASKKALNASLVISVALSLVIAVSLVNRYNADVNIHSSNPASMYGWTDATGQPMTGLIQCKGNDSQLIYVSGRDKAIPITGTAKANSFGQPEFLAFDSSGAKVDYLSLQPLINQCLSSNSVPN